MPKIINRLLKIVKAESLYQLQRITERVFSDLSRANSFKGGKGRKRRSGASSYQSSAHRDYEHAGKKQDGNSPGQNGTGGKADRFPAQVLEDLAVFGLDPPSSLSEVRAARNREIKKYHSDKFVDDPVRFQTSKEIMQIYNAAYDRLKRYYHKSSPIK